jgi:hypothetical protein
MVKPDRVKKERFEKNQPNKITLNETCVANKDG